MGKLFYFVEQAWPSLIAPEPSFFEELREDKKKDQNEQNQGGISEFLWGRLPASCESRHFLEVLLTNNHHI